MPIPVVEVHNVTKTFRRHTAVDDLSFSVPEGAIYGFIGPNGSGKTTTMRMIVNILYPDCGTITVLGQELHDGRSHRIGYLPEERGLYRNMKVREFLHFYGRLKSGRDVRPQVDSWLDRLGLSEWRDRKVETLSKGMSQKVQFIASVVHEPELIILDEPFTGLDPVSADVIRGAVLELRENGTSVIFSTHDMHVAENMCDHILMIFNGKKVLDGPLSDIKAAYGRDTIRISTDAGAEVLRDLAGIEAVNDFGHVQELRVTGGCDPQMLLSQIMSRTRVTCFEIATPSLHDIFVRIAGPGAREDSNA